jgi:cytochrome c oxidase cbb3-type subunit 2
MGWCFVVLGLLWTPLARSAAEPLGRQVYEANCAICHGIHGDGQGEAAPLFAMKPRNFLKGEYKLRSTPSGYLPTDADLFRSIKQGLPGTAMVPQDHLSDEEIKAVVEYIKSLSPRFAQTMDRPAIPLPDPPPRTPRRLASGRVVYWKAECFQCHGPKGRGDGPSARDLAIKPADLTKRPLKSGPTVRDLFRTILTGFDGTPMPAYQFILEDEEVWNLAYYIESLGGPAQQTEDERKGWEVERQHQKR